MVKLNNLQDFSTKQVQELFQNLNIKFGQNFIAVFDLKNQDLISLYCVQSFIVQDEQNRKTFLIKGKQLNDLGSILQQGGVISGQIQGLNGDFLSILDSFPTVTHTYSDNMFGFIGFGIQGY